ncbi:MAG: hypothetical protein IJT16_06715 [Lachnospiraceae bacterium]|nr:hypothetical protein [Lachnospiraceae bacterium]
MDKIKTEDYIDALRQLLEKRYPSSVYSLDGYQECAVCIQSENGYWTVYSAERGNRYDEVICDTVLKACLEFIRKLTHRTEDIASMENELLDNLYALKIA